MKLLDSHRSPSGTFHVEACSRRIAARATPRRPSPRFFPVAPAALLTVLLAAATAHAHPFHVSIAEMRHNPVARRMEVALRVNPLDLEQALRLRAGRPIKLEGDDELDRHLADYVRGKFVLKAGEGETCPLTWVGQEVSLKEVWLYFELRIPEGERQFELSNRVFFELAEDQANSMNLRVGRLRRTLRCTRERPSVDFELP